VTQPEDEQDDQLAVVLAIGPESAAIITEGEDEEDYEFLSFGRVRTQAHRQEYAEEAAASAEGGFLAIAREESLPDIEWGRWLAELEHAGINGVEPTILNKPKLPKVTFPVAAFLRRPMQMAIYVLTNMPRENHEAAE
jgi:hypothetical protein